VGVLREGEEVCGNAYEVVKCASLSVCIKSDTFHTCDSAGSRSCDSSVLSIIFYVFVWYLNG